MASSDVSSAVKFFSTVAEGFTTTLSTTISASATSVGLNTTSGLTNGAVFVGMIEPGTTSEQVFTGVVDVSGSQITNVVWVRGTNVGHAGGVTIVDYVTGAHHNLMTTGILKQHTQTGAHTDITNTGGLTTDTLTATSNATVGGTLGVTGATTLTGAVGGAGYDVKTQANSYKFSVYRNAAQNTGNAAFALFACDTKEYDTGTNVDVATNKGRFTAPIAGFYFFSATIGASTSLGGDATIVSLYKNGSEVKRGNQLRASGNNQALDGVVTAVMQLSANDYVEAFIYGSSAFVVSVGALQSYFQGFLVSAT